MTILLVILSILLAFAGFLFLIHRNYIIVVGLFVIGGVLMLISFLALPWITKDAPGAFQKNLVWLSQETQIVSYVHRFLGEDISDPEGIYSAICSDEVAKFCQEIESNNSFSGWRLWLLAWRIAPLLAINIGILLLLALFSLLFALFFIYQKSVYLGKRVVYIYVTILVIAGLIFIAWTPFLDTMGSFANFKVRLIAALAELSPTRNIWLFVCGILFLLTASILTIISNPPDETTDY